MVSKCATLLLFVAIFVACFVTINARRDKKESGIYSVGWENGAWHNPESCFYLTTHNKGSCKEVCRKRRFEGGSCGGPLWSQCWCIN